MLENRVAIVTGASSGIGRACAIRFAAEGAAVVGCARRSDKLQEVVHKIESQGGKAVAVVCDVAEEDQIDNVGATTVEHVGRIDILANIAQGEINDPARSWMRRPSESSTPSSPGR